ncbi:MAG: arabinan endo-1,5-alpha-L-arabinosidase [Candidatus Methanomethylicaceae archaeon]
MKLIKVFLSIMILVYISCHGYSQNVIFPKEPPKMELFDISIVNDESKWTINNVHDPSIIKATNGWYYIYSTDVKAYGVPKPGIQIRRSKDLINWQFVGYVFNDDKYIFKGIPPQAFEWSRASTLWAPDVKFMNNRYYLYYSASTFGKNQSYIGLATSNSPEGPWKDEGEVIKTKQGDPVNAIDPCLVFDENGEPWLSYGSFWSGIYIIKIDKRTGKPLERGFGINIARRKGTVAGAVEGSYIIYNPKFKKYYLFVSYDSLSSDYNVRVGRSDKITGPYVDYNGNLMTDLTLPPEEVGTKILGGYKFENDEGWIAPGHNSILNDGDDWYIVHHARPALNKNWMYLHIRRILWTDDGWPVVSPERYAGEVVQEIPKDILIGKWERIVLDPYVKIQAISEKLVLDSNGGLIANNKKGIWEFIAPNTLKLKWYVDEKGKIFDTETLKIIAAWDWENWRPTIVFTGLNTKGIAIWGKKIE